MPPDLSVPDDVEVVMRAEAAAWTAHGILPKGVKVNLLVGLHQHGPALFVHTLGRVPVDATNHYALDPDHPFYIDARLRYARGEWS